MSKKFGLKTINIIRGSADGNSHRSATEFENVRNHLMSLGADIVIGDDDLRKMSRAERTEMVNGNPPTLGLNAVRFEMLTFQK